MRGKEEKEEEEVKEIGTIRSGAKANTHRLNRKCQ